MDVKDEDGNTALMWAASKGHPELVKQLLAKGANVDLQNDRLKTALMLAADKGRMDIVTMLVDAGANVNLVDRNNDNVRRYSEYQPEMDALLSSKGAKSNAYLSAADDKAQTEFLASLSREEKDLLTSYIANGVPILNGVLLQNIDVPPNKIGEVVRAFIETNHPEPSKVGFIQKYLNDFLRLVNRAPVLKEELSVWRGIKSKDELANYGNAFLSTSHSEIMAGFFKNKKEKCCMLRMHIKPGVRVIYIESFRRGAYDKMNSRRTPPNLREILVIPPYNAAVVDEGEGNYTVTLTPKAPYVRRAGTRRRRKRRATHRK